MKHFLAIDLGTSAVKAAIFDEHGRRVALAIEEYELLTPGEDMCELPAEVYWEKFLLACKKILADSKVDPKTIVAAGFSSQGESFVPLDANGRPLRNTIVWLDNRPATESDIIDKEFGREAVYKITGQPAVAPIWPACKLLWIKNNEPDVFKAAHKYLMVEDYLIYRLSGKYASEFSVYSSSLVLDINKRAMWDDMLNFIGVSAGQFPELHESGTVVGTITPEAAAATGLSTDTLVVTGAYDHAAGSIGAGVTHAGVMSETTGSAMAMCAPIDSAAFDPEYRVPCHCHAISGKYFFSPWGETAGMTLKWFRDKFCQAEMAEAQASGGDAFAMLGEQAAAVPPGSEGLIMLPFLSGTGSPEFDTNARGVFFGATLKHGKGHFVRSIMEAVTYMIARNVEVMADLGVKLDEIRSLGGGAKSDLWCQIKADSMQTRVAIVEESEQALKGAAILAGVGAGVFADLETASNDMVAIKKRYEPNPDNAKVYADGLATYETLYDRLKDVF
ncbi:MAG: xylulokinase [Planctomycetota bacterium]|jgi:xylulokinase